MREDDLKQLYNDDDDFRRYVDECQKYDGRTVEEEIALKTVQYMGEFYREKSKA